ncbi:2Fe-2S iron-sulfur cluster-binding protein [Paractinoplanes atraurantiacus]|uniref:Ferredoxin-NADP reductase n=1 Tax=Paractinoplanes atraurantiacus TaxID=1036182 RepID=A0A285JW16_9ACTN|nr:2Fe-2S iron-sulfur cluster-binding protein [Actinoplanes atraurantiacus]SNY64478.1 Ferredoxin-NADP reductase [Actinoplanes atraurantiacus]
MTEEQYDVVVIGSGVGGLAAARAIAQFGGERVLILEQHYMAGGMTHEFSREGRFLFGTGLHYMSADAGPFLDFLTDGRVQLTPLPDEYDVLHFPDFDFGVPASGERFRAHLKSEFPGEAEAIDRFFRTMRRALTGLITRNLFSSFPAPVRAIGYPVIRRLFPATYRTLWEQVCHDFTDPRLRAVVAARWGLYGQPPTSSAFGYHASVPLTFFLEGTSHPVGGPKEIGDIALEGLVRHGVEVRLNQDVRRIAVERGRVSGVDVVERATGRRYRVRTRTVVSAGGVRNTYALLASHSRPEWNRELEGLSGEPSALMLFLGLDRSPAEFGPRGENHWFMPGLDEHDGTLYVSFASLNNPAARFHTIEVLELVDPAIVDEWRGTTETNRPESYHAFKAEVTRRLIDRLDRQWPGIKDAIVYAELATPLTYETYQHSVRGSFYGLPATPARLRSGLAGCRTPIKGLVVAGQDAWGPGVNAALAGGIMAANAVLKPSQLSTMWRTIQSAKPARTGPWRGFLRVAGVEELTSSVRKIRLEPLGGGALPFTFEAGQYLKVDLPVGMEPIERSYSIASGPGTTAYLEIGVKKEPNGLGSTFLHDDLTGGLALRVSGPHGEFTWADRDGPLLLIAGGIGITPLISVLIAAADDCHTGPITLLLGARSKAEVPFERELKELAARLPGLRTELYLTETGGRGRIDIEALRPHVAGVARVHLCGPAPMMRDLLGALADLGVPRDRVHTEAFVSDRSRKTRQERAHAVALAAGAPAYTIRTAGTSFPCRPGQTLLAAANAAAVPIPQDCDEGICGTCRVRIVSGTYETDDRGMFSAAELDQGWRLACQTLPTADLTIT